MFFGATISAQSNSKLLAYAQEYNFDSNKQLNFVKFKESHQVSELEAAEFIELMLFDNGSNKLSLLKKEEDFVGYTHYRYAVKNNGIEVANKMIIAHCFNGKLITINGDLTDIKGIYGSFVLSEKQALQFALNKVGAKKYKWENTKEIAHLREALGKTDLTYEPKGIKTILNFKGKNVTAYKFDIYAEQPLYRANVFVDASTGAVLDEQNLICTTNTTGTVLTKYSATQTITCDQVTPTSYRLRETTRGLGVETYNMNNTTTYSATDFTNTSAAWTSTVVFDQVARDAHWGAETTYDYYFQTHNRNSVDNAGYKLLSYVHYSTNYNNAFWDGTKMTYGDGNGTTFTPLTALDVCGHEMSHGVCSNSGNLTYSNESGALNEGNSDIFGTCVENFGRPSNWNWKIGTDITPSGNGIRNMANPNQFSHPDTYLGTFWYTGTADNGGVHTNSGVYNFWFYLLTTGGTGTNDISNTYTVNGIGMLNAAKIAYRAMTVYYTPSTNYANARLLTIQAAKDLFGNCSNEVIQTTNAWYAVGVGAAYAPAAINPNFTANSTNFCTLPATISFNNTTANGVNYTWYFGDNTTSTATNAVHTYSANGTYTVKLIATGCVSNVDSIIKPSYIVINTPAVPNATGAAVCQGGAVILNASGGSSLKWYNSPALTTLVSTGNTYTTPNISSNTTYYVVNTVSNTPAIGGLTTNVNGGFLTNPAQYEIFDVSQNCVLESVVAYANSAGNRTIELRNSSNAVISSTVVNLAVGANTISLNFNLTTGTGYQLGLNGSSASDMYRTNASVAYPYSVAGCVNITNSSAGTGFYYWFYSWKVRKADCVSAAVAVTASVNPLPSINISVTNTAVCRTEGLVNLSATPNGGTFSGPGVSGNTFDPSVGNGTFSVVYNYTDGNGCSNSDSIVMNVNDCTGLNATPLMLANMQVYPNPAKDQVIVKNAMNENKLSIVITDAAGRVVMRQAINSNDEKINISNLANGVYLFTIRDNNKQIKAIKLIKE